MKNDDAAVEVQRSRSADRGGNILVAALVALIGGVALYFALGMPGMDHGTSPSMDGMDMGSPTTPHRLVGPEEFAGLVGNPSATVINVHVPYDGEIEGTDLFLPYDALDPTRLPADRATELLVYCRKGDMSAIASTTLVALGYTNIVELDGGMDAWGKTNRPTIRKPH